MRSPELEFHPKNRIFDLDSLTDVVSKSQTSKSKIFPFDDLKKFYERCKNVPTAPSAVRIFEISLLRIIK